MENTKIQQHICTLEPRKDYPRNDDPLINKVPTVQSPTLGSPVINPQEEIPVVVKSPALNIQPLDPTSSSDRDYKAI